MDASAYLFGVLALFVAIAALAFAARSVRTTFLARNTGALGGLTEVVIRLSLLLAVLEIAGSFGLFSRWVVVAVPAVAVIVGIGAPRLHRRVPSRDASPPMPSDRSSRAMVAVAVGLVAIVVAQSKSTIVTVVPIPSSPSARLRHGIARRRIELTTSVVARLSRWSTRS